VAGLVDDAHASSGYLLEEQVLAYSLLSLDDRKAARWRTLGLWTVGIKVEGRRGVPGRGRRQVAADQAGFTEDRAYHGILIGKASLVLGGGGRFALFVAELDLERKQLFKKRDPILAQTRLEVVLDSRTVPSSPLEFESLAGLMDSLRLCQ
jgi:hypothetical protein